MSLYGAILTGGKNSRMGGFPKGRIRVNGRRLFDRVLGVLRLTVPEVVVSVHDTPPLEIPSSLTVIPDVPGEDRSSMRGVYSVLRHLESPVIVVPWDMPFVTEGQLLRLRNPTGNSTVYSFKDTIQPFPGFYAPELLDALGTALDDGRYSLRKLLRDRGVQTISASSSQNPLSEQHFLNLNSPEDLKQLD